jgi:endonuclease/exonuclease/phosphatase family metal-dependent hydrolase
MIPIMSDTRQKHLRLCLLNCENLFVYMDLWHGQRVDNLNEKEWQALSSATVPNKSLRKLRWLAQTFSEAQPDIIMLNEVGGQESLENFNRHFLKEDFACYSIEGNSDRGIDVAYLVRKTLTYKFDLISHRRRPLNFLYPHEEQSNLYLEGLEPPAIKTHYFSRDALELRVFQPGADRPGLIILLVHLKSKLDPLGVDPAGRNRRAAELKTLVDIYLEVRQEFKSVPVVVAGDFNGFGAKDGYDPEFLPLYEKTDLVEVFDLLKRPLTETATQVNFNRGSLPSLIKIDHVFLSPELWPMVVEDQTQVHLFRSDLQVKMPYAATVEQRTALPSDHYPIVVTLTCPLA